LNGKSGRATKLIEFLRGTDLALAAAGFYNSLEAPALYKFPLLALIQEFLRAQGAVGALMSGSGSTTFALTSNLDQARALEAATQAKFGPLWTTTVPAQS